MTEIDWRLLTRDERTATIRQIMGESDKSATQIALHFVGCSRSAIIGHCHRWGIGLGGNPALKGRRKTDSQIPDKTPKLTNRPPKKRAPDAKPVPHISKRPAVVRPEVPSRPFLDVLVKGGCKWPLWDELPARAENAPTCGADCDEGQHYCEHHRARSVMLVGRVA